MKYTIFENPVTHKFAILRLPEQLSLPEQARFSQEWWTEADPRGPDANYSDSWTLARRTAMPNLRSHTVVFERLP
jgi:hypothetical protein